jgi:hypothetical protein
LIINVPNLQFGPQVRRYRSQALSFNKKGMTLFSSLK